MRPAFGGRHASNGALDWRQLLAVPAQAGRGGQPVAPGAALGHKPGARKRLPVNLCFCQSFLSADCMPSSHLAHTISHSHDACALSLTNHTTP